MIAVECMVYWMRAEFMQGALMPEKLVCIYQSFRRWNNGSLYRPNGGLPCELVPWRALRWDEVTTLGLRLGSATLPGHNGQSVSGTCSPISVRYFRSRSGDVRRVEIIGR
jgi:hypothetical protein